MLKKSLLLIIALLALVTPVQAVQGTWKLHPKYVGSSVQNLIDAGTTIYFQAGKNLFAFDKSTNKVYVLDKDYGMSDATVTKTAYNYDKHYLLVAYNNSNIDIVLQDGTVVNIPDIRDAVYNSKKGINDVSFAGGKAYVATEFGLVVIDDNTMQITNTYYYDKSILSACKVGDVLLVTSGNNLYYDTRKNHDGFDKFVLASSAYTSPKLYPCNDGVHFFLAGTSSFNLATIDTANLGASNAITFVKKVSATVTNVLPSPTGYIANFKANSYYYNIKTSVEPWTFTKVSGGAELYSCYPEGDGTYWGLGAKGLHIKGETTYYIPNGEGITDQAFWTAYNPNDGKFYLARSTDNGIFTKYSGVETEVWTYDGMNWKNVSPVGKATGESGNYQLVFDPRHKSSYFYSTRYKKITVDNVQRSTSTIAHVVNDTVLVNYNYTNCPITFMNSIALDNDGNLWGVQSYTSSASPNFDYVRILPKEKLYDPNVTINDWIVPNLDGPRTSFKAARLVASHGSNIKVFSTGSFGGPIMFWDNGGDIHNLNPREVSYTSLPDNYGSLFSWQFVRCLTPDTLGNVWAGTTSGLFYMNPADAFKPNFGITRPKIKGNYLLDGEDIYAIAIDSLNRKWIATASQGALLLNEDATEILMQFDASNSSLPSNTIYSICPLSNSNSVMFVTDMGVAQYYFDPQDDAGNNDNVQVIPNPVLPEFTGYVTVSGLVPNSFVRITDRDGNVLFETVATGGSIHWDACAANGEHLPTGVYNVYAGHDQASLPSAPATQVRVIK